MWAKIRVPAWIGSQGARTGARKSVLTAASGLPLAAAHQGARVRPRAPSPALGRGGDDAAFDACGAIDQQMSAQYNQVAGDLYPGTKGHLVEYRTLGSTGLRVSALGFGCIRFAQCREENVAAALRRALELGINFFDTARAYGTSEEMIGRAIGSRREEHVLATKSHGRTAETLQNDLETSLRNLRTDHVDILLLHTVSDRETYEQVLGPGGGYEAALRAKEQGKVRHIGVSIHRDLPTMRRAIESGAFEVLMPAYTVMDPEGSGALLPLAIQHHMGTAIMKPLSGGQLVSPPGPGGLPLRPDPVVAGTLRWVGWDPNVTTVIPGMVSAQQVEDNVAAIEKGRLSDDERMELIALLGTLRKSYRYGQTCLRCGYCQPCPHGINVPAIFQAENMAREYPDNLKHMGKELYEAQERTAKDCEECRKCLEHCPAGIDIPERLREVDAFFGDE